MSDWKHVSIWPREVGVYQISYHEDDEPVLAYWDGRHWKDKSGTHSLMFGNHQRKDINDRWKEVGRV